MLPDSAGFYVRTSPRSCRTVSLGAWGDYRASPQRSAVGQLLSSCLKSTRALSAERCGSGTRAGKYSLLGNVPDAAGRDRDGAGWDGSEASAGGEP